MMKLCVTWYRQAILAAPLIALTESIRCLDLRDHALADLLFLSRRPVGHLELAQCDAFLWPLSLRICVTCGAFHPECPVQGVGYIQLGRQMTGSYLLAIRFLLLFA